MGFSFMGPIEFLLHFRVNEVGNFYGTKHQPEEDFRFFHNRVENGKHLLAFRWFALQNLPLHFRGFKVSLLEVFTMMKHLPE